MIQQFGALAALAEDPSSVPAPIPNSCISSSRRSEVPLSFHGRIHIYTYRQHTHMHISNKINLFFSGGNEIKGKIELGIILTCIIVVHLTVIWNSVCLW